MKENPPIQVQIVVVSGAQSVKEQLHGKHGRTMKFIRTISLSSFALSHKLRKQNYLRFTQGGLWNQPKSTQNLKQYVQKIQIVQETSFVEKLFTVLTRRAKLGVTHLTVWTMLLRTAKTAMLLRYKSTIKRKVIHTLLPKNVIHPIEEVSMIGASIQSNTKTLAHISVSYSSLELLQSLQLF